MRIQFGLDLPNIPSHQRIEVPATLNAPPLTDNQAVVLEPPDMGASLPLLYCGFRVVQANPVRLMIAVYNPTGQGIDPSTQTWTARIVGV